MSAEGLQQSPALQTPMYMVKYLNMHSKHNLHKKHEWKSAETKGYSQRQKKNLIQFTMKSAIKKKF